MLLPSESSFTIRSSDKVRVYAHAQQFIDEHGASYTLWQSLRKKCKGELYFALWMRKCRQYTVFFFHDNAKCYTQEIYQQYGTKERKSLNHTAHSQLLQK